MEIKDQHQIREAVRQKYSSVVLDSEKKQLLHTIRQLLRSTHRLRHSIPEIGLHQGRTGVSSGGSKPGAGLRQSASHCPVKSRRSGPGSWIGSRVRCLSGSSAGRRKRIGDWCRHDPRDARQSPRKQAKTKPAAG